MSVATEKRIMRHLIEQAKKCQTVGGATLLLGIKRHIEGAPVQIFEGMTELWEVADHLAGENCLQNPANPE